MDPATIILNLITGAPTLLGDIPKIQAMIGEAWSNDDLTTKLKTLGPATFGILTDLGATVLPQVAPALHAAAAAMTIFDTGDSKKWLQNALNLYVKPTPLLVVDGIIGKKTIAAMTLAQPKLAAQFGITVKADGWAGMIAQGLLQTAVALLQKA